MNASRIEELCRSPIDGCRQLWVERLVCAAISEFAEEAIADMVRPSEEAGNEGIARVVAQKRIRELLP